MENPIYIVLSPQRNMPGGVGDGNYAHHMSGNNMATKGILVIMDMFLSHEVSGYTGKVRHCINEGGMEDTESPAWG